jgi:predicted RNA-binding Zn ribbon-like protein
LNTRWADRDGIHDALATAADATAWLDEVRDRLPVVRPTRGPRRRSLTATEAAALRDLRDALRRVAAHVTDDPRPTADDDLAALALDDAVATINAAVGELPSRLLRRDHGVLVADRRSPDVAAAWTAAFAADAVPLLAGDHESGALRACLAPACVLYFVQDHPRREWCSPACGNRARVARHYERTQSARRDAGRH